MPTTAKRAIEARRSRVEHAEALLNDYLAETAKHVGYPWDVKPDQFPAWSAAIAAGTEVQSALLTHALSRLAAVERQAILDHAEHRFFEIQRLIKALCRRKLVLNDGDVATMLTVLTTSSMTWSSWVPVLPVAKAIARWYGEREPDDCTTALIQGVVRSANGHHPYADERKGLEIFQELISPADSVPALITPDDDWGTAALAALSSLEPRERDTWSRLLQHAATADASKPSAAWLNVANRLIHDLGDERFAALAADWLAFLRRPASDNSRVGGDGHLVPWSLITEHNSTVIKGIAWMCSTHGSRRIAAALGDAALACFIKIPGIGARCTRGGNACIVALGSMTGLNGTAQLVRLQQRVTYSQARRLIDSALDSAATRSGLTRYEIEDLAVPDFDLIEGQTRIVAGQWSATITIDQSSRVVLAWTDEDGRSFQTEPTQVKRDFPDESTCAKQLRSDIESMLAAQRLRMERFPLAGRSWDFATWADRVLNQPLLSSLSRRLIWTFRRDGDVRLGAWVNGEIVGLDDQPLDGIEQAHVTLFHPALSDPHETLAWQLWLERHQVVQPFKQAHREVYRITDVEKEAGLQSARYAGHILHQHQFAALCKARGWTYRLQSALFDGANTPTLILPDGVSRATFSVDVVESDELHTSAGVGQYVVTENVSFWRGQALADVRVPLDQIAPIHFSEVMRDVDLFVGVSSVGADPGWKQRDGDQFGAYWKGFAFGRVSESAQTRRELLERLLPGLHIGPRCTITDRFLVVRGDLRTYQIHLGSGNVLMEPNHEYLCIVRKQWGDGERSAERIYLPFEGDATLSLILSKAFMLANDAGIQDKTILRQIRPD